MACLLFYLNFAYDSVTYSWTLSPMYSSYFNYFLLMLNGTPKKHLFKKEGHNLFLAMALFIVQNFHPLKFCQFHMQTKIKIILRKGHSFFVTLINV